MLHITSLRVFITYSHSRMNEIIHVGGIYERIRSILTKKDLKKAEENALNEAQEIVNSPDPHSWKTNYNLN